MLERVYIMVYNIEMEEIRQVLRHFRDIYEWKVNLIRPSITVKCKGRLDDYLMKSLKEDTMFYVGFVWSRPSETLEVLCDLNRSKWEEGNES